MLRHSAVPLLALLSAAAVAEPLATSTLWSLGAEAERWQLPGDERAEMALLRLRREVGHGVSVGIDSLAAVGGQRGGFITLGVGADYRRALGGGVDLEFGAGIGAGGGRGGHELAGGGLLLRESLGVGMPLDDWRLHAGVSRVDFPNGGTIHSTQAYVGLDRAFRSLSTTEVADDGRYRLDADATLGEAALALVVRDYRVRSASRTDSGAAQGNLGVVGARWQTALAGPWVASVEAAGAAHGASNGYMEILGGIGVRLPLGNQVTLGATLVAGAGGGGGVDTGGGTLVGLRGGLDWAFDGRDSLALEVGRTTAPSGHFSADTVTLGLARRFGPSEALTVPAGSEADLEAHPVRVRVTEQTYRAASAAWSTRPIPDIGVLGVQADYFVDPHWYLTGQGLAAYRGESGAYMTGLVGAGTHWPLAGGLDLEAEGLAGAAGGGGVAVASGAVAAANVSLGHRFNSGMGVRAGVGRLRAVHGGFAANVFSLSLSMDTTLLSGRR